jgi:hypothetical protein
MRITQAKCWVKIPSQPLAEYSGSCLSFPALWRSSDISNKVQINLGINQDPYLKDKHIKRADSVAQMEEHMLGNCEVLSLTSTISKK